MKLRPGREISLPTASLLDPLLPEPPPSPRPGGCTVPPRVDLSAKVTSIIGFWSSSRATCTSRGMPRPEIKYFLDTLVCVACCYGACVGCNRGEFSPSSYTAHTPLWKAIAYELGGHSQHKLSTNTNIYGKRGRIRMSIER